MTGPGEGAGSGPEAALAEALAGRRYDDPYPPEDLTYLNCFAPADERPDVRSAPR